MSLTRNSKLNKLHNFSVSGYSTTLYVYIGEFNTKKNRDVILSWMTVSIGIANIFIPLCAMLVLSFEWNVYLYFLSFRPWRLLMIVFTSPGIIAALWIIRLPESPRFLIAKGNFQSAKKVLEWINDKNGGDASGELKRMESADNSENKKSSLLQSLANQTLPLFQMTNLRPLVLCSVLHFGTFAISNGVGVFVPEILKKLSLVVEDQSIEFCQLVKLENNSNSSETLCNDSIEPSVFINTSYLGIFYTIAFILLAVILKFFDRRFVLSFNLITSAIGGFLMTNVTQKWMIISSCFVFVAQSGINISLINSILCETIPAKYLTMAICLAMTFGRLGSVLTSNVYANFIETNCELIFNIFASFVCLCFVLSFHKIK